MIRLFHLETKPEALGGLRPTASFVVRKRITLPNPQHSAWAQRLVAFGEQLGQSRHCAGDHSIGAPEEGSTGARQLRQPTRPAPHVFYRVFRRRLQGDAQFLLAALNEEKVATRANNGQRNSGKPAPGPQVHDE